jgi:alanine-alpha-ketoisovalerate/valine-pyruvate aminotransferase
MSKDKIRPGRNGGTLKTGGNNGGGRPKRIPELNVLLAQVMGEEKDGMTAAEAILKSLRQQATKGNMRAAELLLKYTYGNPIQKLEHTGAEGGAIAFTTIKFVDEQND